MSHCFFGTCHGKHSEVTLPKGDVIIHAGDVSKNGTEKEIRDFLNWYSSLDFKYKIFISGNHDYFFEEEPDKVKKAIPDNLIYLNDSAVEIEGIKLWGSPVQPYYCNMAFNKRRGAEIRKHWRLIPESLDILVTHGPPFGILDTNFENESCGCEDLLDRLKEIKPKYFIFGHIHEAAGKTFKDGINYINACLLDKKYNLVNPPVCFEFP